MTWYHRLLLLLGLLVWVGAAAAGAIVFSWIADRAPPTRTIDRPKLLTPSVPAGGELLTERTVFRDKLCYTTIYRYMIDSRGVRFDRSSDSLGTETYPNGMGKIGQDVFTGREIVPIDMAPGPADYYSLPCYYCNPIHWIVPVCEPVRQVSFTVTEPRVSERARDAARKILEQLPALLETP